MKRWTRVRRHVQRYARLVARWKSSQTGADKLWDAVDLEPGEKAIAQAYLILDPKLPPRPWWVALHPSVRRAKRRRGAAFLTDQRFMFRYIFGPDASRRLEVKWSDVVGWNLDRTDPRPGRTGLVIHVAIDGEGELFALSLYPDTPFPEARTDFFDDFVTEFRRQAEMGRTHAEPT